MFILINYKKLLLSLEVHTPDLWYHVLRELKSNALVEMYEEVKIMCQKCGAMNTVDIAPSALVQTAFCRECGAELHLIVKRSRPASFAPP